MLNNLLQKLLKLIKGIIMPASNYTPIYLYASGSAGVKPAAGNPGIANTSKGSEVALNYADGILYYANSAGTVTALASASATAGQFSSITDTGLATAGIVTNTSGGVLGTTTSPTLTALTISNGGSGGALTLNSTSGLPLAITALGSGITSYFNFGYPIINTSTRASSFAGQLTITGNAIIAGVVLNSANNIPVSSPNTATSGSDGGWQSFTPVLTGNASTVTFTYSANAQQGRYLVIGNMVYVQIYIGWIAASATTDFLIINNLPISGSALPSGWGNNYNGFGLLQCSHAVAYGLQLFPVVLNGGNKLYFFAPNGTYPLQSSSTSSFNAGVTISSTGYVYGCFSYSTS